jgi:thioredoxin-related protein
VPALILAVINMKRLFVSQVNTFILFLVLIIQVQPGIAQTGTRDAMAHFFHQGFDDLQEELKIAREKNKTGVLVMFDNAECPWCARMKATVLNQVYIQDYFRKHFRITRIDTDGDAPVIDFSGKEIAQKDFAFKHNRVRATPVFMFYDLDGKILTRFTGATRDARIFYWLGEYVVDGHYKKMRFTAFKRKRLKDMKDQ